MTLNIAHRGARSLAPENTLAAARKGLELGAGMWETDTAVTRDGRIVLFHDHSLRRTTDVTEVFGDRPSAELCDFLLEELLLLDPGKTFVQNDPFGEIALGNLTREDMEALYGERIPTLEQGLILTRDHGWKINVEMKTLPESQAGFPLPRAVLETIRDVGIPLGSLVVSSFHHPYLEEIKALEPGIAVQALIGGPPDEPLDWGDYRFPVYNVRASLISDREIRQAKEMGKGINLWTVNETGAMIRFLRAGADGIITDYPQRLASILEAGDTPRNR